LTEFISQITIITKHLYFAGSRTSTAEVEVH